MNALEKQRGSFNDPPRPLKPEDISDEAARALAAAIVEQACADYLRAKDDVHRFPVSTDAHRKGAYSARSIERFFKSPQFAIYSDLDPDFVARHLTKQSKKFVIAEKHIHDWPIRWRSVATGKIVGEAPSIADFTQSPLSQRSVLKCIFRRIETYHKCIFEFTEDHFTEFEEERP